AERRDPGGGRRGGEDAAAGSGHAIRRRLPRAALAPRRAAGGASKMSGSSGSHRAVKRDPTRETTLRAPPRRSVPTREELLGVLDRFGPSARTSRRNRAVTTDRIVELSEDHPGFSDPTYRARRDAIAAAAAHREPRDVAYDDGETSVWRTVRGALDPLHERF